MATRAEFTTGKMMHSTRQGMHEYSSDEGDVYADDGAKKEVELDLIMFYGLTPKSEIEQIAHVKEKDTDELPAVPSPGSNPAPDPNLPSTPGSPS